MTTKTRTCDDCNRKLTSSNRSPVTGLCNFCYDLAGWENDHQDGGHEPGDMMNDCPICNPALTAPTQKAGHTNTAPKSWSSHASCDHEKSAAARAKCRKARAQG